MGEVVAAIDDGLHFAAVGADEAEAAFAPFPHRPVATEGGDGDGQGQVVPLQRNLIIGVVWVKLKTRIRSEM